MAPLASFVLALFASALLGGSGALAGHFERREAIRSVQADARAKLHARAVDAARKPATTQAVSRNITFTNKKASQYYVDGKSLPEVGWDVGPSWSGLMPISNKTGETRKLFFWFFPPGPQGSLDELIFWTNGGPGCSSLEGFLQENGPINWNYGQAGPTKNEFSWTNLSSVLWVEQPVGTGFSQGTPNIKDEIGVSEQLAGFFQQFLSVFSELKGKKLYLTSESYGGQYIPYFADYLYSHPTAVDLDLQGIWLGNPAITWDVVSEEIPAVNFVHKYEHVFAFNQSFMSYIDQTAAKCGYADYMDKYVTYPPKGPLPLPGKSTESDEGCDVWWEIYLAASAVNPVFNPYRIFDVYPLLWDILGEPGVFSVAQKPVYFNRQDVKKAIHAPLDVAWSECGADVFSAAPNGDTSPPTSQSVLGRVIEQNKRSVIMHGLADYVLIADGTRIAIQNMTWGGKQGFQSPIVAESFVVDGYQTSLGVVHEERGLTYYEVELTGHMVPQFAPWAAYQSMQYLMGRRSKP